MYLHFVRAKLDVAEVNLEAQFEAADKTPVTPWSSVNIGLIKIRGKDRKLKKKKTCKRFLKNGHFRYKYCTIN